MDDTQTLILESLNLLLLQERARSERELKEHRHPFVQQEHKVVIEAINSKLEPIFALLNPEEEADESGDENSNNKSPAETTDRVGDSTDCS